MELVTKKRLHLVSGEANLPLAEEIADPPRGRPSATPTWASSPTASCTAASANRSGAPTCSSSRRHSASETMSINDSIMQQLIMVDAAKRASAKRITVVCPYYGYSRQDRKAEGREPITAKLVADMFRAAGAKRMVSVDLHSGQIQGFFDGPVDHLTAMPVLLRAHGDPRRRPGRRVARRRPGEGGRALRQRPPRRPGHRAQASGQGPEALGRGPRRRRRGRRPHLRAHRRHDRDRLHARARRPSSSSTTGPTTSTRWPPTGCSPARPSTGSRTR